MGSEQTDGHEDDANDADAPCGPRQKGHAGDHRCRAQDNADLERRGRDLIMVVAFESFITLAFCVLCTLGKLRRSLAGLRL